jgi:hypothetical protein
MIERDDLMDAIRRARPDDLASARTPAAQALLEEILSMPFTQAPEVAAEVADDAPAGPRRSRRRRLVFGGVAAAVLAIAVLVVDSGEQTSAATVDVALTRLSSTLEQSGRAEVHWRTEWERDEPFVQTGVDSWEFAGDDSSVTSQHSVNGVDSNCAPGDPPACAEGEDPINRYVDGESYYIPSAGDPDGTYRWYRDVGDDADQGAGFDLDPKALLDGSTPPAASRRSPTRGSAASRRRGSERRTPSRPPCRTSMSAWSSAIRSRHWRFGSTTTACCVASIS